MPPGPEASKKVIKEKNMGKTVRMAIIGMGNMGSKYAEMINGGMVEGMTLAAVCCRSEGSLQWARQHLKETVTICRSEDALYEHETAFDALLIATPHKAHAQMALRAFQRGKHVLCDKPAAVSLSDACAMNEAAREHGRVYGLIFHQKAYTKHVKVKELLDEGAVGDISRVLLVNTSYFRTAFYHRSCAWRSSWRNEGGGLLINQGQHILNLWQWLFGMPEKMYACIPFGKYNDFLVDDEATLIMEYGGKMTGTLILSTQEGSCQERLEIVGTKGRILLEGNRLELSAYSRDTRQYGREEEVIAREGLREERHEWSYEDAEPVYQRILGNFAEAVREGKELIASGRDGVNTLMLAAGAYLSARKGGKLSFPVDKGEYDAFLQRQAEAEEASSS